MTLSSSLASYNVYFQTFFGANLVCAENAELYAKVGVPFVMGTTGGDRERLYKTVEMLTSML